jgi:protoporphyrinogen oxidase
VAYPKGPNGIEALPLSLEQKAESPIRLNCSVIALDLAAKTARTSDGLKIHWKTIIATLPLPSLVASTTIPPCSRCDLRAADVSIVEIGATKTGSGLPAIWTYVPDESIPFYRLTRLERISPDLAPENGAAILLEIHSRSFFGCLVYR